MKQAIYLLTIALLIGNQSFAGNEGGAGGDGVKIGNNLYLIDLVEAGAELSPYFKMSLESDSRFENVIKRVMGPLSKLSSLETNRLVAIKLLEVSEVNHTLAISLLQAIESFQWILVNHALVDIKDEDSVLEFNGGTLTQLAIRRRYSITISRTSWNDLNNENKAALIIHEALYAMNVPKEKFKTAENKKISYYVQSSPNTRALVGILFASNKDFLKQTLEDYGFYGKSDREIIYEITNKETGKPKGWVSPTRARGNVLTYFCVDCHQFGEWRDPGNTFPEVFCTDILNRQLTQPAIISGHVLTNFRPQFEFEKTPGFIPVLLTTKNAEEKEISYLNWDYAVRASYSFLNANELIDWGKFNYRTCTKKLTDILADYRGLFSQPSVFTKTTQK